MAEAPIPLMTPNSKIKEIEFWTNTDKQTKINFKIMISNNEMEFYAKIIDKNSQKNFYKKEIESNLLKNPYLLTGGNILGIFQILEYYIKKNNYKVFEENKSIKLEFNIEHPIIKYIEFILLEEKKDINTQICELSSYVYEILVNKIKYLEDKNNEYQKQIDQLIEINKKNEISNLEKMIKDLYNLNNNKPNEVSLFNSKIKIDESLIKSWLNNRKFKTNLLFRMTEDGDSFEIFHKKCDNKGITIIFIETIEGYRFGGYTELQWDSSNTDKDDNSTFIFSFNYNEKYNKRNNYYSIGCNKCNGPKFGFGPQIWFDYRYNLRFGKSEKNEFNSFVLNNKFVDGKNQWTTKELEVYQIIYC